MEITPAIDLPASQAAKTELGVRKTFKNPVQSARYMRKGNASFEKKSTPAIAEP